MVGDPLTLPSAFLTTPTRTATTTTTTTTQTFGNSSSMSTTATTLTLAMQLDSPSSSNGAVIGGAVGGALALILLIAVVALLVVRNKRNKQNQRAPEASSVGPTPVYNTIPANLTGSANYGAPPRTSMSEIADRSVDTYGATSQMTTETAYESLELTVADNADDKDRKLARKRTRSSRRRRRPADQRSPQDEYKPLPWNAQQPQSTMTQ